MSIFFDINLGSRNRRFRKAVDADVYEIQQLIRTNSDSGIFGDVDVGALIELAYLSVCLIDEEKIIGFISFNDHPDIPGLDPATWEIWIRNLYRLYFLSHNTLFVHFMCCNDDATDYFVQEALVSVFMNNAYLLHVVFVIPPDINDEYIKRYDVFSKRMLMKVRAYMRTEARRAHPLYYARRTDFVPRLRMRAAVEQDNDDIVAILDQKHPRLKEIYGEFYISELIASSDSHTRKLVVAEKDDVAIGVMGINTEVDTKALQKLFSLKPYHGLVKSNNTFGRTQKSEKQKKLIVKNYAEPILTGEWCPYDEPQISGSSSSIQIDEKRIESPQLSAMNLNIDDATPKDEIQMKCVNLQDMPSIRVHSYESYYQYAESLCQSLCQDSIIYEIDNLDEDPFDYDIVNIDPSAMNIYPVYASIDHQQTDSFEQGGRKSRERKKSILDIRRSFRKVPKTIFEGEQNVFVIELFGLRDDIDERLAYDFLTVAFEIQKNKDYCAILVPCTQKYFPLLQHFSYVPTHEDTTSNQSLYVAHRNSVIGKLRVRKAELADVPHIAYFLSDLDAKHTMWTVENCVSKRNKSNLKPETYVMFSGTAVIGIVIVEYPTVSQIEQIRLKYDLEQYHNHKYYYRGHGSLAGFINLQTAIVYPVFEPHFNFFIREVLRLSGSSALIWLTPYKNQNTIQSVNTFVSKLIPLLPRQLETDPLGGPEFIKFTNAYKEKFPFYAWFLNRKMTSVEKVNIDTRIVIIGHSRTSLGFLNSLLFGDTTAYLTFTNITVISPDGMHWPRHTVPGAETMFHKQRSFVPKWIPYLAYVNIIQGKIVEIDRKSKYVRLKNGSRCYYDKLFLFLGKQYQHPDYIKAVEEKKYTCTYESVSETRQTPADKEEFFNYVLPRNVFIVNGINIANKALKYAKKKVDTEWKVIVYGSTISAYCCISALLETGIEPTNIIFVDPFPPENKNKVKVCIFANVYVDQAVHEEIIKLGIKVYRSYYFQSWTVGDAGSVDYVEFASSYNYVKIPCSSFFYYGRKFISSGVFNVITKSGIAFHGGVLIDHQCRTSDPDIYAAGPFTRYFGRYRADLRLHKYYDSFEVGEWLGNSIKSELDPIFNNNNINAQNQNCEASMNNAATAQDSEKTESITNKLPNLVKPNVICCNLPGGFSYLEVRAPGKHIPHYYLKTLAHSGSVMETFKLGYFKLHMNQADIVDGITCLTKEPFYLLNFVNLFGQHSTVLNNVKLRYESENIYDFFEYFRAPWSFFLYQDRKDELLAIVKELLPRDRTNATTIQEALYRTLSEENFSWDNMGRALNSDGNLMDRVDRNLYVDAITKYVMKWVSDNDILLPMYLNTSNIFECVFDPLTNSWLKLPQERMKSLLKSSFRKRKLKITTALSFVD